MFTLYNCIIQSASFIASPGTARLSHKEPASAGKSDGRFDAQDSDKTKALYKKNLNNFMDLEPLQYLS
jgi:hypothetical protein